LSLPIDAFDIPIFAPLAAARPAPVVDPRAHRMLTAFDAEFLLPSGSVKPSGKWDEQSPVVVGATRFALEVRGRTRGLRAVQPTASP